MSSKLPFASFSELVAEAEKIGREAESRFGRLSGEQINWKPGPQEWSVGQCFEHLILTNRPYFPLLEEIASGRHTKTLWQRVPLLPSLFGKLVLGAVSPQSSRKIKARKGFLPASSQVDDRIIGQFRDHQEELMRLMKGTEGLEHEKIIITSAVSPLVTYSLLNGYRILITHERRHLLQAERAMGAKEFPRN